MIDLVFWNMVADWILGAAVLLFVLAVFWRVMSYKVTIPLTEG